MVEERLDRRSQSPYQQSSSKTIWLKSKERGESIYIQDKRAKKQKKKKKKKMRILDSQVNHQINYSLLSSKIQKTTQKR